jgi:predicted RNA-binding protein YlxR (DUF448 family)
MNETMNGQTVDEKRTARSCVGCGVRDDRAAMVRISIAGGEVVFDALFHRGGGLGRGAHVHPRAACLAKAPRGLARAFKTSVNVDSAELGRRLSDACDRRMVGLLLAARRTGSLAIGADAARSALRGGAGGAGGAPLAIVAVDAGSVRESIEVEQAISEGRAIAWKTKSDLGGLLGEKAVALCAVRHGGIASELKLMRAAADAGMAATREGAECRRPEAR